MTLIVSRFNSNLSLSIVQYYSDHLLLKVLERLIVNLAAEMLDLVLKKTVCHLALHLKVLTLSYWMSVLIEITVHIALGNFNFGPENSLLVKCTICKLLLQT